MASMRVHVTNGTGLLLGGVRVTAQGPTSREGVTGEDGALRFVNLTPGTYRLRFAHDKFITLERDVSARTAETAVDVTLSAAPEPPPKPPAPPPAAPPPPAPKPAPPVGDPKTVGIPRFRDSNFIGAPREGFRAGLNPERIPGFISSGSPASHIQTGDEWLYVVAAEGSAVAQSSSE